MNLQHSPEYQDAEKIHRHRYNIQVFGFIKVEGKFSTSLPIKM